VLHLLLIAHMMSARRLPSRNSDYSLANYWDERYKDEDSNEWLVNYDSIKHVIRDIVDTRDTILMLGCGNSTLSRDMYNDGYLCIINSDFSDIVTRKMRSSGCMACSKMEWLTMDATWLLFKDNSFDIVIEKAMIDAFLTSEKSMWSISESTQKKLIKVFQQVHHVLIKDRKDDRKSFFICVSFTQPHFLQPIFNQVDHLMKLEEIKRIGEAFHYHIYIFSAVDCSLNQSAPTSSVICNLANSQESISDQELLSQLISQNTINDIRNFNSNMMINNHNNSNDFNENNIFDICI